MIIFVPAIAIAALKAAGILAVGAGTVVAAKSINDLCKKVEKALDKED